jgi:MinD superfamily P-loop ATPase
MIRVSVTGGKGGTGKSFVATNLAILLAEKFSKGKLVLADLDVEAPNDHLLLGANETISTVEITSYFPKIDYSKCTSCGACVKVCDTGAIIMSPGRPPFIFPRLCSGCKACYYACPYDAISKDTERVIGYLYTRIVKVGDAKFTLVTGELREGEEHTPPAVIFTRRFAENLKPDILLNDTGAGTGSSITVAIQYSQLVIAVTEPTPMGLHDLESILKVTRDIGYRTWIVVNRSTLGPVEKTVELGRKYGVERFYMLPYSERAVESYVKGIPIVHLYPEDEISAELRRLAQDVGELILESAPRLEG